MESVLAFARRRAAFVFGVAIVAACAGVLLVSRVTFDANVLRLLPQGSPSVREFQRFLQSFGSLDHLYVVFESKDAIGEHGDFVDRYVEALRRAPEIESVDAQIFEPGKDWSYLSDRELYLLGADGAATALARFEPPRLDGEIAHARDLLSMPSAQIKALVQQDPLGLLSMLRDRMGQERGFVSFDPAEEGYVSPDGHSRLVILKPKGPPFDTDFCKALFARLAAVEATTRRQAADDPDAGSVTIQAAGAYRVSLEAEQLIRREGTVNAIGSLALLMLVVFAVFRTPWVMLYGFAPLALAAVLTLGVNGLLEGSLSPATSGAAGMLFGLGIDGVVLLYLRYLEERREGASADQAIRRMSGTASSVVLAQVTTAATFLALLVHRLSHAAGSRQPRRPRHPAVLRTHDHAAAGAPAARRRRAGGAGTDGGLARTVRHARRRAHRLGQRDRDRRARRRVDKAAPGHEHRPAPGADARRAARERGGRPVLASARRAARAERPPGHRAAPRDRRSSRARAGDTGALGDGERHRLPAAVGAGTGSRRQRHPCRGDDERRREARHRGRGRARRVPARHLRAISRARAASAGSATSGSRTTDSWPMASGRSSPGSWSTGTGRYQAVTYLYPKPPVDIEALRRIVHDVDPSLRLTGLPVINHDLRRQVVPEFLKGLAIGTLAVAILIYMVFRTIRHTLLALLPTAVGFVWSAGVLALLRVELDLFSLFAAVTFVGIAVDYGIYVLYRYRFDPSCDMNAVLTKTGAAIIIACATALIGFGTLVNSSYRPLHVFGLMSIVTLVCCLTASIVFLPALVLEMERWSRSAR